ncbi:WD40 repeat-like-containing domain protein [Sarocladium implicatum]|nr:WD40 repeat-like-containing domain protein [Sarocladium implicatum]
MDDAQLIASKISLNLDLPPSCIQFCPAHPDLFVVGTYNLEREDDHSPKGDDASEAVAQSGRPQNRNGSLLVFRLKGHEIILLQTVLQPSAVLDLRFHPTNGDIFAVASSTATLGIYKLDPLANPTSPLMEVAVSDPPEAEIGMLFLQCQWHHTEENWLGVTSSSGFAYIIVLDSDWRLSQAVKLSLESELEPWAIAFSEPRKSEDGSTSFSVYTGSDDSILRYATYNMTNDPSIARSENDEPVRSVHTAKLTKKHGAGVTAILPLSSKSPDGGRLVVTGSYDDHIRLFAIHDLDQTGGFVMSKLLVEENLGGGVWRLDPVKVEAGNGSFRIKILVSCMHAGARLVVFRSDDGLTWTCKILARFEEHKSMNYGSDFLRGWDDGRLRCVSTSFYDRLLCVWDIRSFEDQ